GDRLYRSGEPGQFDGQHSVALHLHLPAQLGVLLHCGDERTAFPGGHLAKEIGLNGLKAGGIQVLCPHCCALSSAELSIIRRKDRSFIMQRYLMVRMLSSVTPIRSAMAAMSWCS